MINPFSYDAYQSYNAGHSYKINTHYNTGADGIEIGFLPGRISSLTLSVLMSSVLTDCVSVHVCISVQVLVEAHAVEQ